jgi:hypothetical protein
LPCTNTFRAYEADPAGAFGVLLTNLNAFTSLDPSRTSESSLETSECLWNLLQLEAFVEGGFALQNL